MFDASTAGRGPQPKTKTINVEANLMAQRLIERRQLHESTRRRLMLLGAITFTALFTIPALYTWMATVRRAASMTAEREAALSTRLIALRKKETTARPAIQESQLLAVVRGRANNYLGRISQYLNCVEPDLALRNLKVEVLAGNMKMTSQADAESYESYKKFIVRCQEAVGKDNVFPRSVKASNLLGDRGVVFDLEHKVQVGQ